MEASASRRRASPATAAASCTLPGRAPGTWPRSSTRSGSTPTCTRLLDRSPRGARRRDGFGGRRRRLALGAPGRARRRTAPPGPAPARRRRRLAAGPRTATATSRRSPGGSPRSATREAHRGLVAGELAFALRTDDDYAVLAERAARKREALAAIPSVAAVEDAEVVSWYFHERLGQEVPPALDAWASAHGWGARPSLVRAPVRSGCSPGRGPPPRRRRGTARPARAG